MNLDKKNYAAIDLGRLVFALLIPLLHIDFGDNNYLVGFLQQYVCRLGVPFFFCVSGLFLGRNIENLGAPKAHKAYMQRTTLMFGLWLAIYFPILLLEGEQLSLGFLKQIFFRTPAYLWFLGAVILASVPFCHLKRTRWLYLGAFSLYLIGTLISGSYQWLTGGISLYNHMFLTSRNSCFFALPMMLTGELVYAYREKEIRFEKTFFLLASILLACEMYFVRIHASSTSDTSMYMLFPVFFFFLIRFLMRIPLNINGTLVIRKFSSALYVGQYGAICAAGAILKGLNLSFTPGLNGFVVYVCVLVVASLLVFLSGKNKLAGYMI